MRLLLLFMLTPLLVVAATQPTIDDLLDSARFKMRAAAKGQHEPTQTPALPSAEWSLPLALAGTTVLLTAVLMAFTSLLAEIGIGLRRPKQVRIRLVGWHDSLSQRHLPQVNLL
jgi:hypothetical protein